MSNDVKIKLTLTDNVSKQLSKISKSFDKLGGRGSGASLFGNVGAKAISKGFSIIGSAADDAVGFLKDSVMAARDAEVSEGKLALALKNNVAGWNGSTDAIEALLTSQMRLGFSDDEQRDALTKLITANGDVELSTKELSVAMDIARFKNLDLGTASDILNRALHGNRRALKELGITDLPKAATASQILKAITEKLGGSAETYSKTLDGKVAAANATFTEAQEKLGKVVTPALIFAMDGLSGALNYFSGDPSYKATGALKEIEHWAHLAGRGVDVLGDAFRDLSNSLPGMGKYESGKYKPGSGKQTSNVPNGPSGVHIQGLSEKDIMNMIDKGLYFKLQKAGTGS